MSTRCNVLITDGFGHKLWFYRHSDGYPRGVRPTLQKFMKWVKTGKIRNNVGQATGWLVILGNEEYKAGSSPTQWKVGAYEPTTGQHGDIEYLYTIDLLKKTLLAEKVDFNGKKNVISINPSPMSARQAKAFIEQQQIDTVDKFIKCRLQDHLVKMRKNTAKSLFNRAKKYSLKS
jgi:hypothetical protein